MAQTSAPSAPSDPLRFIGPDGRQYAWRRPVTREQLGWQFDTFFGWKLAPTPHPDCVARGHTAPLDVAWSFYSGHDYRTGRREPISVLRGARGLAGKSVINAGVSTLEGLGGLSSVVLGGSFEQSRRIHELAGSVWDRNVTMDGREYRTPFHLLMDEQTGSETKFRSGATRRVLTASRRAVRSKHPERARLDEVDEMALDVYESAMGQTMSDDDVLRPTHTSLSSTLQHVDGTFQKLLVRAAERQWPVYEVCYRESLKENGGWLDPVQVEHKRREVSDEMWNTEYELGEPSLSGRIFTKQHVDGLFNSAFGTFEGRAGEVIRMACCSRGKSPVDGVLTQAIDRPHCPTHTYAVGIDWAATQDWLVVAVYRTDVSPWWLVHWERVPRIADGGPQWPERIDQVRKVILEHGGGKAAAHDATGMGGRMAGDTLGLDDLYDVQFSGTRRDAILTDYIVSVQRAEMTGPRITWAYDSHRYLTREMIATGRDHKKHTPDDVVAGALARSMSSRNAFDDWDASGLAGPGRADAIRDEQYVDDYVTDDELDASYSFESGW